MMDSVINGRLMAALEPNFESYLELNIPNAGDVTIRTVAKQAATLAEIVNARCESMDDRFDLLATVTRNGLLSSLSAIAQRFQELSNDLREFMGGSDGGKIANVENYQLIRADGQRLDPLERLGFIGSAVETLKKLMPELTAYAADVRGPSLMKVVSENIGSITRIEQITEQIQEVSRQQEAVSKRLQEATNKMEATLRWIVRELPPSC
jgi:hypothetical protein